MRNNIITRKLITAKITDCLDGTPEGLKTLLDFYQNKHMQLDEADEHFIASLETSLREQTCFSQMFLRLGRNTSKPYRKKLVNNLIFNQFIAGKAQRKAGSDGEDLVPSLLVVSPTMRCNLHCNGCYSGLYPKQDELSAGELDELFGQIRDMGIYFVVISGGEPFMIKDTLVSLFKKYNDMFFLLYTNGTLIDAKLAAQLGKLGNVSPAISVEGWEKETSARRGPDTWNKILQTMGYLRDNGVLFGISVTVTRHNMEVVTDPSFVEFFKDQGIFFGWYFMFMPVGKDPMLDLVMTPEQRVMCGQRVEALRDRYPLFLADFWNDGEIIGGCLAAGRHYAHVLSNGSVEPCVFAHFGIDNIREKPLLEIINSPFFKDFRKAFPYNDAGNLKRPCMIIDNPKVLRDVVHKHNACPGHLGSMDLIDDPETTQWIDAYADRFAKLVDPEWEKMINDPQDRWYKGKKEYQDLFH